MSYHYTGPDFAIRGQRTGTSPSKRRWSEAGPMTADSHRLISVHTVRGEGP
jgi:hypothetical protein